MGRKYHSHGSCTAGSDKTAVSAIASTSTRARIYQILIGCAAAPASQAALWSAQRFTGDGTGTSFTPVALDPGDPAALLTSKSNYSAEPTVTANAHLCEIPLNQQATFSWMAPQGGELVVPASSGNGIAVKTLTSTGTAVHDASIWWEE